MTGAGRRRVQEGVVVSAGKMNKTVTVKVERRLPHPQYKKYVTLTSKFLAHDEKNQCREGDRVKIVECRPLSARKRWRLLEIVERRG